MLLNEEPNIETGVSLGHRSVVEQGVTVLVDCLSVGLALDTQDLDSVELAILNRDMES